MLVLLRHKSREIVKSVIGFLKVSVSAMPHEMLRAELQHVVNGLLMWAGESKNRFRLKIKTIFERLVDKFGGQTVLELVPQDDRKLIEHIVKMKERSKVHEHRRKQEAREANVTGVGNATKAAVEAAVRAQFSRKRRARPGDEESDDDVDADPNNNNDDGRRARKDVRRHRKQVSTDQWIQDDNGSGSMDLLNTAEMARRLRTSEPQGPGRRRDGDGFKLTADGRIIVEDDSRRRGGRGLDASDSDGEDGGVPESALGSWTRESAQTGGVRGASLAMVARRRREREAGRSQKHAGDRFKAKKASGDVKKKGDRVEPYAYVQLDSRSTTKKGQQANLAKFSKHRNPKAGKGKKRR